MVWTLEIHEQEKKSDGHKIFWLARAKEYKMGRKTSSGTTEIMFGDRSISRDHAKVIVDYSTYQRSNINTRPSLFFVETKARFDSFINGKPCGMEEIVTVPGTNIGVLAPREVVVKFRDGRKQKVLVPVGKRIGDRFPIRRKTPDMRYPLKDGDLIGIGAHGTKIRVVWKPLIFCGSQLKHQTRKEFERCLEKIGAHSVKSWSKDCTHLVMERVTVTFKVLWALVHCKPIVSIQFPKSLANDEGKFNIRPYGSLPNAIKYRPKMTAQHAQIKSNQCDPNPSRSTLHKGISVWVAQKNEYSRIAEATGVELHLAADADALQEQLRHVDASNEKSFWLKKKSRDRNKKQSVIEKILSNSNLIEISEQQLIHSILCVEDLETAMLVEDISQIGSQAAHIEDGSKRAPNLIATQHKAFSRPTPILSTKVPSEMPKSKHDGSKRAPNLIASQHKASSRPTPILSTKVPSEMPKSKHVTSNNMGDTTNTIEKAEANANKPPQKPKKPTRPSKALQQNAAKAKSHTTDEGEGPKIERKQQATESIKLEPKATARKPLSGQWTTRKKTPSKSVAHADEDDHDSLPSQSEQKRPPRRKRAWQSVAPEPEKPQKKRAALEDDHVDDSAPVSHPEGTSGGKAFTHVNAGGLTWVSKKAEPESPVPVRDAETGETIQRAVVEDFVVAHKSKSAPQHTLARRLHQGPDFKRFRKNVVKMSVEVIRCGDMLGETSSNNAVMTTLQEMFADDEHEAEEASRLW